ncbi:hypothetical protein KVR01_011497 [Diaporthe batatas]|uniref:uncharacterized protein n=1 Tax=Diaporthe batatas TaxID=748121 RepID=UPI001D05BD8F|nr:uncharacterized protein KVR01_011497 [Diaporthe batatas]KAG8159054.1 hypothetical protein KVR01_011497 [Diaporthe batatas]
MPLMSMSLNVQELESPSTKRTHTDYAGDLDELPACDSAKQPHLDVNEVSRSRDLPLASSLPNSSRLTSAESTPAQSSPPSLLEPGNSNLVRDPASPDTPTRQPTTMPAAKSTQPAGQGPPAKKRKRLTEDEKKAQADEKAAKGAEREKKRKEKEAEAERKKAEVEKKKAEAERKKREKEEEAERKQRAQPKIGSFFTKQTLTSNLKTDLPAGARSPSPAVQERNEYQRLAQEFFVKENVRLATNKFALSPDSQAAKIAVLDEFVAGTRAPIEIKSSDPLQALGLPHGNVHPRGKTYASVRKLLSDSDGLQTSPIDLTTESHNSRIQHTQQALRRIPLKHLKFYEDVRPAYYGTVTSVESLASLRKLARNPIAKDLPLNYDYDSEAEWVDDGDDGEGDDVSLMDEDDADEEEGEAMDDFLDDSEDAGRGPRMMAGTMEPESSGVCFEDRTRRNPNPQMYKFRMEFMIPNLKHHHSVDPFSDQYWAQEPKATSTKTSAHGTAEKAADSGAMAPPPVPSSAFAALGTSCAAAVSNAPAPQDLVPAAQLDSFKAAVLEFSFLPKQAMVATLKKKLDSCTMAQIKATLDHVAEKPKKKGDWKIKAGM